jgi:hypothetical protein
VSRPDVRIRLDGNGCGEVLVDGHNIASAVTGLRVEVLPGPLGVEVFLRMRPMNLDLEAVAKVAVDEKTREALERLGWAQVVAPDA